MVEVISLRVAVGGRVILQANPHCVYELVNVGLQ